MDDRELKDCFTQLRSGDKSAFSRLYEDMKHPVYAVAYRILLSREAAEDVTQDVFVKLFRSPPDTSVQSPRAWIFRMARNRAIDVLRQRRAVAIEDSDAIHSIRDSEPEDEDRLETLVTRLDVETAIARLSDREREIVALHLHAELPFTLIASIVNLSLPATYRSYRKALDALRNHLNGETK